MSFVLVIDQGTTSSRAIIFDENMKVCAIAQQEFTQHLPQSGWVEHDPEEIWQTVLATCKQAIAKASLSAADIISIGITNQRETTIVWEKATGKAIFPAIVWQDRRTADICKKWREQGYEELVHHKTGLLIDPYFSASKLHWILNHVDNARERALKGDLLFGTIDSFLLFRLTGGAVHASDATNAARTMLYDIHQGEWSCELCETFDIPMQMLAEVKDCAGLFGVTKRGLLGAEIPVMGIAGDQQAASIGQACFKPGMVKATYGTGCFLLLNTGEHPVSSSHSLLTTVAYQLDGQRSYALEGSIFIAGAVVQWLRDGLQVIEQASDAQKLALKADTEHSLVIVPAFTGLGAPYWNPHTRGAIFGLTRNSGAAEFARAALESVGFQSCDLLHAMQDDWDRHQLQNAQADSGDKEVGRMLRVDGGMSASDFTMQFVADMTGYRVERPEFLETTALGAAWLAGMSMGIYPQMNELFDKWSSQSTFNPRIKQQTRDERYERWQRAVNAAIAF